MINYIIVFMIGAIMGSRIKNSFFPAIILGGIMNIVMLWSSFQILPQLQWFDQILNQIPIIGPWIVATLGVPQALVDVIGAAYAFLLAALAGGLGWFLGGTILKRWL